MAEVQLYDGVYMRTSGNTDLPPNSAELQRVWLWDTGPTKPVAPKRPEPPRGKVGDPAFDLAKVEFAEELEEYTARLKAWKQAKDEFAAWHKRHGGPIEIPFWSCDAYDALDRDAAAAKRDLDDQRAQMGEPAEGEQIDDPPLRLRYYLSSRTRGSERLPNRGLPEGKVPGNGQAELERRMREGDADMLAALKADPVFGKQEIR